MPIRIGLQVDDSGGKLSKLATDLDKIASSVEKIGPKGKTAATGINAVGTALTNFERQAKGAQSAAEKLFAAYRKLGSVPMIGTGSKGGSAGIEIKKIVNDLEAISSKTKTARADFYQFAKGVDASGRAVKGLTTGMYQLQAASSAQAKATQLLQQSESKYEAALAKTIAYKEKGYQASLKRTMQAEAEATAVRKLTAANMALSKSNIRSQKNVEYSKAMSAMQAPAAISMGKAEAWPPKGTAARIDKTTKSYSNLDSALRGVSGGMGKLWLTYGNMVPMIAGFAAAATAVQTFQAAMDVEYTTKYTAALDNSVGSIEKIQTEILNMREVASGPKELAEGFREMVKAGKSVNEVLEGGMLKTMSRFSTVSGQDLASSIQLAVTQVNAFAEVTKRSTGDTLDYAAAADQMTAAVHSAPITFSDLTQSLAHTTELSTTVGASFDEITTALALMGEAGIKSSKAGTSLRTGLTKLMSPTGNVAKQFKALGINLKEAFDADGTMNVKKALMMYKKAYETLDPLSKVRFMKESLGLRSQKAIAALMRELDNWDAKNKMIRESGGEINRVYDELRETLKIASTEFANAFTSEAIKEITPMLGKLAKVFNFATDHVKEMVAALKTAVQITGVLITMWAGGKLIKAIQSATRAVLAYNVAAAAGGAASGGSAAAMYGGAAAAAGGAGKKLLAKFAAIGTATGASFAGTFIAAATATIVGWNIGRVIKEKLDVPDIGEIKDKLVEAPGAGKTEEMENLLVKIDFYKKKIEKLEVEPNLNYDQVEKFKELMGLASIQYDLLKSQVEKEGLFDKANQKALSKLDDFKMNKIEVDLTVGGYEEAKIDMEEINALISQGEEAEKDRAKSVDATAKIFAKLKDELKFLEMAAGLSDAEKAEVALLIQTERLAKQYDWSNQAMLEHIALSRQIADKKRIEAEETKEAADAFKKYTDAVKDVEKFTKAAAKHFQGLEDQEIDLEIKIKAADTSEMDALAEKYKKLYKASRGGKVAGTDKQLVDLKKQYNEINTEEKRKNKALVEQAKEYENLAGEAAKLGVDGWEEQLRLMTKARELYSQMVPEKGIDQGQLAAAKAEYETYYRRSRGGKVHGSVEELSRLKEAYKKAGSADKGVEGDKAKLAALKKNTEMQKEAHKTHLANLKERAEGLKEEALGYDNNKLKVQEFIAESAKNLSDFHTAWIGDIKRVQKEGYGKVSIQGGKTVETGTPPSAVPQETTDAAQENLKLGKLAVKTEEDLKKAKKETAVVDQDKVAKAAEQNAMVQKNVTITKEAAAAIVAENDKIEGMVAGATEPIVNIGGEWTNVTTQIEAAGVSVADTFSKVEDGGPLVKTVNGTWIDSNVKVVVSYEKITDSIEDAITAAEKLASTGGNYGPGATGGARAMGGPVTSGSTYLVGEKGPELFSPTSSGHIIPNHKLTSNGESVNINLSVNNEPPVVVQGTKQSARDIAAMFSRQQRLASA